jgi:hypothetical protein
MLLVLAVAPILHLLAAKEGVLWCVDHSCIIPERRVVSLVLGVLCPISDSAAHIVWSTELVDALGCAAYHWISLAPSFRWAAH